MRAFSLATRARLSRFVAAGADILFPPACALCHVAFTGGDQNQNDRLCHDCHASLVPTNPSRCDRCSAPVGPHLNTAAGCVHCRTERWAFNRVFALGAYDDWLRDSCLAIKRAGGDSLAASLAELLWSVAGPSFAASEFDLVVPVPHFWRDRIRRPHLPPVTLARTLATRMNRPCELGLVTKICSTPEQSSLPASERRTNLTKAFRASRGVRLNGGRVLLVDDVLTTGTTAHRVSRVLLEMGADVVSVAVVARGIGM